MWGIGDIEKYKINSKYSLSFPLQSTLLDRNILISFVHDTVIIENDWLGAIPVFFNQKEKIVSTLSNFCLKDKTIDDEGLSNFFEFGYSVFEKTMFNNVKFMKYFSKITKSDDISIEYKKDSVLDDSFLEKTSTEDECVNLMQEYISQNLQKYTPIYLIVGLVVNVVCNYYFTINGHYWSSIYNLFSTNERNFHSPHFYYKN